MQHDPLEQIAQRHVMQLRDRLQHTQDTLLEPNNIRARQAASTVHVHPNGRFLYGANRSQATVEFQGKQVFKGGENSIVVYSIDQTTGELVYQSAWGAGAREIVGVRLPSGTGVAGAVVGSGVGEAIPDCRSDPRWAARIAAGTGYVPYTMLIVPLERGGQSIGALTILDRRDGRPYREDDLEPAALFADLAVKALDVTPGWFTSLGVTGGV